MKPARRARPQTDKQSARQSARQSAKPAANQATQAKVKRPRWLAPVAVVALAAGAYAFYFLDHLPQASLLHPGTEWHVESGEQLRLHGLPAGDALQLNFAGRASARLSFPPGTRLLADPGAEQAGETGSAGFQFDLFNVDKENAQIKVRMAPGPNARASLSVQPSLPDPKLYAVTLRSDDAPVAVEIGIVPNPDVASHGQIQRGGAVLDAASLVVPAGAPVTIGILTDPQPFFRAEVGGLVDGSQRLAVDGVEIGTASPAGFARRWAACGAPDRTILWKRLLPALAPGDCAPGWLAVTGLDLGARVGLRFEGSGFTVSEGETDNWKGFAEFQKNEIVKAVLGSLVLAFVGWVALTIRGRSAK